MEPGVLAMNALPVMDGSEGRGVMVRDWSEGLPTAMEEACAAARALRELVQDAVYLDEDCYTTAVGHTQYQQRIQTHQRHVTDLENEVAALRLELERKDEQLAATGARQREAQQQIAELQQELENNAVVFRVHYQELMTRTEEIERLKAVIEGVQGGS